MQTKYTLNLEKLVQGLSSNGHKKTKETLISKRWDPEKVPKQDEDSEACDSMKPLSWLESYRITGSHCLIEPQASLSSSCLGKIPIHLFEINFLGSNTLKGI